MVKFPNVALRIRGRTSFLPLEGCSPTYRPTMLPRPKAHKFLARKTSQFTRHCHEQASRRVISRRRTAFPSRLESRQSTELRSAVPGSKLLLGATLGLIVTAAYLYFTDTRSGVHKYVAVPALRILFPDAEDAHHAGVLVLKSLHALGLNPKERWRQSPKHLEVEIFGHTVNNPLAISGGLDKNGEVVNPLFDLGPAVVEIGGVTPLEQPGNAKPRVWRVVSQNAMINRYGLNSWGAAAVARQLQKRVREFARAQGLGISEEAETRVLNGGLGVPPGSLSPGKLLAVQIAKNKDTNEQDTEAVKNDYVSCVQHLGRFADIIVVNVSSPNTPGLRSLQKVEPLKAVLQGVVDACQAVPRKSKPAVMVKVSPDEKTDEDIIGICEAVWQTGVDGVIVGNTTRSRPLVESLTVNAKEKSVLEEQGGYSGPAMFQNTLSLIGRYREILDIPLQSNEARQYQRKVIFASGGISNGQDVAQAIEAGASMAMVYTGITYEGTGFISRLKEQLVSSRSSSR